MFCCAALYQESWPPLAPPPSTLQWSAKGPFPCLLHSAFDNSLDQTGKDTLEMTVTHLSAPGGQSRAGGSCFEFIALSIRRPEVALLLCTIDSKGHRAWFLCLFICLPLPIGPWTVYAIQVHGHSVTSPQQSKIAVWAVVTSQAHSTAKHTHNNFS